MDEPIIAHIEQHIEALIFASDKSISLIEIRSVLEQVFGVQASEEVLLTTIVSIQDRYRTSDYAIEIVQIDGGYQFLTKSAFYPVISQLQASRSKKKLSQSAIETLAIIAYKQPITKLEIEQIRGVNCDYTIQKLLEKDLIKITGKAEMVGRPILYATSARFADYFGINSTAELPQFNEVNSTKNEIGIAAE